MMTRLAVANAVMRLFVPIYIETSVATLLRRREAGDACPRPDSGGKYVASNTTGDLGRHRSFSKHNKRLPHAERVGTAFAN